MQKNQFSVKMGGSRGSKQIKGDGNFVFVDRPVQDFTAIILKGMMDVVFTQSDTLSLKVHADQNLQDLIETTIENGVLTVSMKPCSFTTESDMYVECSAPLLTSADVIGNGDIIINQLKGKSFSGQIMGQGDMKIKGQVINALFDISGNGDLKAKKLIAEKVELAVSGMGDAKVHATKFMGLSLSGMGDVKIFGNPAQKDIIKTGMGDVRYG